MEGNGRSVRIWLDLLGEMTVFQTESEESKDKSDKKGMGFHEDAFITFFQSKRAKSFSV